MADKTPSKDKTSSWETIKTILIAISVALVFRSLAYEPFHIPSGSMKPNLLIGDYIWVSKFSYGYSHFSFPLSLPLFEGRIMGSLPQRGDVVVFRPPSRPKIDFIKRVVGLPNDKIQVKNGQLHINNVPVEMEQQPPFLDKEPNHARLIPRHREGLPRVNGEILWHDTISVDPYYVLDNTDIYTVPEGHLFVMGDNRDESIDSRVLGQVGFIPYDNIIGRAEIVFFSTDGSARFWEIWKWPASLRMDRFLKPIK